MNNRSHPLLSLTTALLIDTRLIHGQSIRAGTSIVQLPLPPIKKELEWRDDLLRAHSQSDSEAPKLRPGPKSIRSLFKSSTPSPFAYPAKTHKGKKPRRPTH